MSVSNFCKAKVEVQPSCTGVWTDISGEGAAVAWDGGGVMYGKAHAFGEDAPMLAPGKTDEVTVTIRAHYTEGADEFTELFRAAYENECDHGMCVRWTPLGATVGNKQYTTISGFVIKPVWPAGAAGSADITMSEGVVVCADIAVDDAV